MKKTVQKALNKIKIVKRIYIICGVLADALLALTIALLSFVVLSFFLMQPLVWTIVAFAGSLSLLISINKVWLVNDYAIVGFLDANYPQLEESSSLVLIAVADLNLLQQLQSSKVSALLQQLPFYHHKFTKRLRINTIYLFCAALTVFFVSRLPHNLLSNKKSFYKKTPIVKYAPEKILPEIKTVNIQISPPAYTRLPPVKQNKLALEVAEGSIAAWRLNTNVPVHNISLVFDEHENIQLKSINKDNTAWAAQKVIINPGFYQVVIDGKLSDLYQVQVIKDMPPVIQIKSPSQYTYIDAGEKPQFAINTVVTDDYGVSDAVIYATIAKGSGEAVKFKEQKLNFPVSFSSLQRKFELKKTIALPSLNMEPGDELYFYIQATDNHRQLSRTDVYIVSIQDTAQLLSMDGILSGANIKPEYFRSERQIILDAESLLKAKDTLNIEKFKDRSNDLGTDQKLLRLRYGKFLGEEAEGNIADPRLEGNDKLADPKDFGNGAKILDEYTDKHDNAEDAQFFDPTVKAQLKATLTEMWKAELQLRLYKPQDALPFAFKALRLLKDLQQKSRSYVAKTAYNPSPLKMDKRLSGDLNKIIQPDGHREIKPAADRFEALKRSVSILEQLKINHILKRDDYLTLKTANEQLSLYAARQPGVYLTGAGAMRRILFGTKLNIKNDAAAIETAIQKILPFAQILPQGRPLKPDMGLANGYFSELNHLNR